jgi:hypothetical protein
MCYYLDSLASLIGMQCIATSHNMSIYSIDVIIKTASPIKIWDGEEVKPLLATAERQIKTLFDILDIKRTLKVHYNFSNTPQRHFNVSLEYVGSDKASRVPAKYNIKKGSWSRAYNCEAMSTLQDMSTRTIIYIKRISVVKVPLVP